MSSRETDSSVTPEQELQELLQRAQKSQDELRQLIEEMKTIINWRPMWLL